MIDHIKQMKNEGQLQTFFEKHDQLYKVGTWEIFAAKKGTF